MSKRSVSNSGDDVPMFEPKIRLNIGSNFRIADRTLVLDFIPAFKIAGKYHAEALCAEASNLDFLKCDSWRCFLIDVRTFFDENPEN